jgi:hypothetical protein
VLSGISEQDKPLFADSVGRAGSAAEAFAKTGDIEAVMRTFNGKAK